MLSKEAQKYIAGLDPTQFRKRTSFKKEGFYVVTENLQIKRLDKEETGCFKNYADARSHLMRELRKRMTFYRSIEPTQLFEEGGK